MKKLLKSGICGSMNSTQMHCLLQKSQHLRLLFNEQYMNSNCKCWLFRSKQWTVHWCTVYCGKVNICGYCSMNSTWTSQHLRLLFNEQYMNSNRVTPKRVKKKKKGTKTQTWVQWIQTYTKWWVVINDRPHKGASLVRTIVSALTSNTNFAFNGEWRTNMLLLPSSSRGCMTVNYKH